MEVKNFKWNGFGFPVIFDRLPAIKVRGEVVPDIDFVRFSMPIIKTICEVQTFPLSGNQVKFIRNYFNFSLREFAKFMNVTHQSVMRWESKGKDAARIDINTEIVLRLKVLKKLNCNFKSIETVVEKINHPAELEPKLDYVKKFKPVFITEDSIL